MQNPAVYSFIIDVFSMETFIHGGFFGQPWLIPGGYQYSKNLSFFLRVSFHLDRGQQGADGFAVGHMLLLITTTTRDVAYISTSVEEVWI